MISDFIIPNGFCTDAVGVFPQSPNLENDLKIFKHSYISARLPIYKESSTFFISNFTLNFIKLM